MSEGVKLDYSMQYEIAPANFEKIKWSQLVYLFRPFTIVLSSDKL